MLDIKAFVAGNPNAGKTTLFNDLAGTRYHVGNYPGVTVETKKAKLEYKGANIELTDLPGIYSLTAFSDEELVARNIIADEKPDVIVNILDSSNLARNMYLSIQFMELGLPMVLVMNMMDVAEKRGMKIDVDKLSDKLGIPVISTVARQGKGSIELMDTLCKGDFKTVRHGNFRISYGPDIDPALDKMQEIIEANDFLKDKFPARWTAVKYFENDDQIVELGIKDNEEVHSELTNIVNKVEKHLQETLDTYAAGIIADYRYGYINSLLKKVMTRTDNNIDRVYISDKLDRILTHRLIGPAIMIACLYVIYQFVFWASEYPVGWLEFLFAKLSVIVDMILPDSMFKSLLISGIIDGVGGVLGFTPLIMFMFFVIAILEDSGYMARIAYMLDKVFSIFGMQGSSVVSYIISGGIAGGCAVPGVMASRTIKGSRERLLTILTAPFMPCGAKIPVYAVLIAAFFHGNKGFMMLIITLFSWAAALIAAKLISLFVIKGDASSFVMEMPPYRFPTLRGLIIHSWERTWMYIRKAGTVILAISIILWALMTFPQLPEDRAAEYKNRMQQVEAKYAPDTVSKAVNENADLEGAARELQAELNSIKRELATEELRHSIAGKVGTSLEPISQLAGFDWRTNIALIGGVAAKEVVVSTLGTAYSMGDVDVEDSASLSQKLKNDDTWTKATAVSLIVFIMLYAPCFITIVTINKETGRRKWGLFTFSVYTVVAYAASVATYQAMQLF